MSNEIRVTGNLGRSPEMRKAGDKSVVEFSVYCDEWKKSPESGDWVQDDERGEWYRVSIWLERLGEQAMKHLKEGARVTVFGHLDVNRWEDKKTGDPKFALVITADEVMLNFSRVEEVRFREKRERGDERMVA